MHEIIIAVFGCDTKDKYKQQILKIEETWGDTAKKNNILVLFFLGEQKILPGDQYIHLPGVKNDYLSASYKQNLGVKHIHDNYQYKYVLFCGSDTFLCIHNLLRFLNDMPQDKPLYIGGHGCYRQINNVKYYFHSGGAGIIVNNQAVSLLYDQLESMVDEWVKVCDMNGMKDLVYASDVCFAYYIHNIREVMTIKADPLFYNCNYLGYDIDGTNCCVSKISQHRKDIVSCHSMSLKDFDEFNKV